MINYDPAKQSCSWNETTNSTQLTCKEGFVDINSKCEKYDVCNKEHRAKKGNTKVDCAKDKKSHCYPTLNSTTPDDQNAYTCVCDLGYERKGGIH